MKNIWKNHLVFIVSSFAFLMAGVVGKVNDGHLSVMDKKTDTTTMYVACRQITFHEDRSNESEGYYIPYRDQVIVYGSYQMGSWMKIRHNGKDGYFYNKAGEEALKEELPEPAYTGKTKYQKSAMKLVEKAVNEWNTSYAHGQSEGVKMPDGTYGFDCSGFASYILNQTMKADVDLYRVSKELNQLYETKSIYNKGLKGECKVTTVIKDNFWEEKLEPGDVLFFNLAIEGNTSGKMVNHCGIYIGNGEMVHSSHSFGGKVRIMLLDDMYKSGFVAAKRYMPSKVVSCGATYYTAKSSTTIYNSKESNQKVIKTYGFLQPVKLLFTDNGNWAKVELSNGKKGYVLIKNLCKDLKKGISCKVRNSGLKLYKTTSTSSKYITLSKGKKVSLHKKMSKAHFYQVKYQSKIYYVYAPNGIEGKLTTY